MPFVIGIDPGKTGALAVIETGTPHRVCWVGHTPLSGDDFNIPAMVSALRGYESKESHVFIEKVHAMPGQGVTSMFNFGRGFGVWIGIITSLGLPITYVTPQRWKKELMDGKKDKDDARQRVMELFPKMSDYVYRKKDIGRADAILIAEYGRRTLQW